MSTKMLEVAATVVEFMNETNDNITCDDYREDVFGQYMSETKKNLLEELHRIAAAVRNYGGCWYSIDYDSKNKKDPRPIRNLVVMSNGCIGAAGYNSYYYSINGIFLIEGKPVVSCCSVGPTLWGIEDPIILMDEEKFKSPAFLIYDIENDEYICNDEKGMLEEYQKTLDADDDIVPVAYLNARRRIGGKYYGMNVDEYLTAKRKERENRRK